MHFALRALEFDRIVEALTTFALTPLGSARLATLEPYADPGEVATALAATTEGVKIIGGGIQIPLKAPSDFFETLAALDVEGRPLEPVRLVALADFLASMEQARSSIRRLSRETFPLLSRIVDRSSNFDREVANIRRAIDPAGEVVDNASPALRQLRDRLRKLRSRLRGTLESYVRGRETSRYLQDLVVTDRNGRYVLVVKAEHRGSIPGIVHGASSSGASVYLEPLSTVEVNNEVVAVEEQEKEEVRRILLELTNAFRLRTEELEQTLDAAADLDVVQAKARFAYVCKASAPVPSKDGRLELRGARHPLLIEGVASRTNEARERADRVQRSSEPVGVDVLLIPPTRVLVITGPNTGGKTVALKAAGLLSLMAQAGLHLPAEEGSQVPVFRSVFADIGDEQSIAANLSTFSWHVTNLARTDRALIGPALVLLDEVGAGTDPIEGGALGMAVIDHFRKRGAMVIATTHYEALKSYASTTEQVVAAAFGFNPDTFAPTYRLLYGSPGTSLALEMAARLGLPATIVSAARQFRNAREAQLADHMARIDRDLHALEHDRRAVTDERSRQATAAEQLRARETQIAEREAHFRRRLDSALQEQVREARREIDAVIEDLKKRAAALANEAAERAKAPRLVGAARVSTGETGSLKADARTALADLMSRLQSDERSSAPTMVAPAPSSQVADQGERPVAPAVHAPAHTVPSVIAAGIRVRIGALGVEGVVQSVHDRSAEVLVRGKRIRANVDQLEPLGQEPAKGRVTVNVQVNAPAGSSTELNVIGCTVPEALDRADKFLDQAIVTEQRNVRLVHGHGKGHLRKALAAFLHDHPLVSRFSLAPPEQGGGGVTMVELKD